MWWVMEWIHGGGLFLFRSCRDWGRVQNHRVCYRVLAGPLKTQEEAAVVKAGMGGYL